MKYLTGSKVKAEAVRRAGAQCHLVVPAPGAGDEAHPGHRHPLRTHSGKSKSRQLGKLLRISRRTYI